MENSLHKRKAVGFFALLCFLVLGFAPSASAIQCPSPDSPNCYKKVHIYNNTDGPIWAVIQAGFQDPDPWLQAAFGDVSKTYAETHYSRVYINPTTGIPAKTSVTVMVPWYSTLQNDPDPYADWWNGGRIVIFDNQQAIEAAHNQDKGNLLKVTAGSMQFACDGCTSTVKDIFWDKNAFADGIPFQLLEHTFANVKTTVSPPEIIDLKVGYNISYLDQVYLPIALAPCLKEPCRDDGSDKSAVGYLGTTQSFTDFRTKLRTFRTSMQWPRYNGRLDADARPRLPGAYNLITDALNQKVNNNNKTLFTPNSVNSQALNYLVDQWKACTTTGAGCPQTSFYRDVDAFFRDNFQKYLALTGCGSGFPKPANLNGEVGQLYLMQYVYGWVPFNAYCTNLGAGVNALNPFAPNPWPPFSKAINEYIQLQYNFAGTQLPLLSRLFQLLPTQVAQLGQRLGQQLGQKQLFNPFTLLVHGSQYLNANSYAFSVDDAAGFQSNSGEGLVIAVGGAKGLPNNIPVPKPADFNTDFEINLGDTKAQNRPEWTKYGICKNVADVEFPPFPPNENNHSRTIVVPIATQNVPCTVTIQDAAGKIYQIQAKSKVPWPAWTSNRGFDSTVISCPSTGTSSWCQNSINELSRPDEPRFALITGPSCANPNCNPF